MRSRSSGIIGIALVVGFLVKNLTDDFLLRSNGKEFWMLNAALLGVGMRRLRSALRLTRSAPPMGEPAASPQRRTPRRMRTPLDAEAVIINCSTREQTTLALVSALRHARLPVTVIDCESTDGSYPFFAAAPGAAAVPARRDAAAPARRHARPHLPRHAARRAAARRFGRRDPARRPRCRR